MTTATAPDHSSTRPATRTLANRVRNEQIRALYVELPFSALGMIIGGLIVVAGLWGSAAHRPLMLLWLGLIVANQTWRLLLYRHFKRRDDHTSKSAAWARLWALGALFSGLTWGSSALFMFDAGDTTYQAYLVVCLVGVTAGALALVTIELRSFYFFILPTLVPIIARLLAEGDRPHVWMAAVCTLMLCVLFKFGIKLNRELEQSLYNRFELDDQRALAEQARAEAETATQAKSKFLQATSHDLRNDVQAMSLLAESLSKANLDAAERETLAGIAASTRTVGRLADDLLSVSRLDAGDIRPSLSTFALQPLLDELAAEFDLVARQQSIALTAEPSPLSVCSDRMLLERMLRNLVSNALRYTPANGSVAIRVRDLGKDVRIEVRDTGIGIAAEDQRRIFEEFYQIAGAASNKGLGIGLSIVQRFADLLSHTLRLESAPGQGSCFGIELPRAELASVEAAAASTHPNPLRSRLLVFVDDDPAILGSVGTRMRDWELRVIAATDGEQALSELEAARTQPDLILVDYQLGAGGTGIDLVDRMRHRFARPIPAVMLTGYSGSEHRAAAAERGIRVLEKPVKLARLRLVLEDCLKAAP